MQYSTFNIARNDEILHHMLWSLAFHVLHILMSVLFLISWAGQSSRWTRWSRSLMFRTFSNPSSLLLSGDCCDPACADCNYYFLFCIRDDRSSASCLVSGKTKTYHNYKHLVFRYGDSLGNGWQNPLKGSFTSWKVRSFLREPCFVY